MGMGNAVYFSNEYVTDMIGDTWTAVNESTPLPNGGVAPADIRPSKGKRQYVDVTSMDPTAPSMLMMRSDDDHQPGQYKVSTTWLNVRADAATGSALLGRVTTGPELSLIKVARVG